MAQSNNTGKKKNELIVKKEEVLLEIKKNENERQSRATRVKRLLEVQKGFVKREVSLAPIKEPVMFFGRRNNTFEILEDATRGQYEFKHSSGEKRYILVVPETQSTFGIGKSSFKGYWAHEDHPITGWPSPVITTEQVNIHTEKLMNDIRNWQAKSKEATGIMILYIGIGIAAIIIAAMLYKTNTANAGQTVYNVIQSAVPIANETINQTVDAAIKAIDQTPILK